MGITRLGAQKSRIVRADGSDGHRDQSVRAEHPAGLILPSSAVRRVLIALGFVVAAGCLSAGISSNALHRIVEDCLDTGNPHYLSRCPSPQVGYCQLDYPCSRTTQVWALNRNTWRSATSRCAAAGGFVHGLALRASP
jgi:hypothetical protein